MEINHLSVIKTEKGEGISIISSLEKKQRLMK